LGCAVLASDCSGNREQIEDGVDGVLSPLTPEALAEQIQALLDDPKRRSNLGKQAAAKPTCYPGDLEALLSLLE
jgi:glycosyltransferase involved in cell wall biosynthesis